MINKISVQNTINKKTYHSQVSFGLRPILVEEVSKFKRDILLNKKVKVVGIACHHLPDGDTTSLAKIFERRLRKYGKKVILFLEKNEVSGLNIKPKKYTISKEKTKQIPDKLIILDFNSEERLPKDTGIYYVLSHINPEDIFGLDHHSKTEHLISPNIYVDDTSYSCCGVGWNFFKALGEKLKKKDVKDFSYGMLSDLQKSKMVKFEDSKIIKMPALDVQQEEKQVLEEIESRLSKKNRTKVYEGLDILSNLTKDEKAFRKRLFSEVQVAPNGKLAYVIIPPDDKQWKTLGMHNTRNSAVLRDLRTRLTNGVQEDSAFTEEQKANFKDLQAAIIFYKAGNDYQMSIHSKNEYAQKLKEYVDNLITDKKFEELGGHPDRMGGRVHSLKKKDAENFIKKFLIANEEVGKQ